MTYVLIDGGGIVRNFIRWDGEAIYDPAPLLIREYRDGLVIGEPYDVTTDPED